MFEILETHLIDRVRSKFVVLPDQVEKKVIKLRRVFLSDGSFVVVSPEAFCLNSNCHIEELEVGDELPFPRFKRELKRKISTSELTQFAPFEFTVEDFRFHYKKTIHYLPDTIHLTKDFGRLCGLLVHGGFKWIIDQLETRMFALEPRIKFELQRKPELEEEIRFLLSNCLGLTYKPRLRHNLLIYLLHLIGFEKENSIIPPNVINCNNQFVSSLIRTIFEISTFLPFHLAVNLFFISNGIGLKSSIFREEANIFGNSLVVPFDNLHKRSVVFVDQISGEFSVNLVDHCITNAGFVLLDDTK